jgi:hypothetical protein
VGLRGKEKANSEKREKPWNKKLALNSFKPVWQLP